ncbi:MAG: glucosyl-3-phosphoglycerate synthase [Caldilineaceae bacterium]|nr:glucosyl-3-phosphoglycerate synthase [Caldilineaceae bacterium]
MPTTKQNAFRPIQTALVPVLYDCDVTAALAAARTIAKQVVLVGLVAVPPEKPLSAGAEGARKVRQIMRKLDTGPEVTRHTEVLVGPEPWVELVRYIAAHMPDLLVMDWDTHFARLNISQRDALSSPPCDIALVRGPFPEKVENVLLPMRGGRHAELALTVGLSIRSPSLSVVHLRPTDPPITDDTPFHGLNKVLRQMPEIEIHWVVTDEPAQSILVHTQAHDLVVMGATLHTLDAQAPLGPVADHVLNHAKIPVIVVKTMRPLLQPVVGALAGTRAISILVDKWFAENTFHAEEFKNLTDMVKVKQSQGLTVSLALPALNEEETVGKVITTIKSALMDEVPLVDEIVLIDSNSTDRTREIAAELGVPVHIHQELLPEYGARSGKGEALWKSLYVTKGDIIAWIDTDIVNIHPRFVYGILGPLIMNPDVQYVKGFYRRPLRVGDKVQAGGGGRVTELMARPLINLFYPELSGIIQPLSGEYAGRRYALERSVFYSGYGVETGMLIDIFERFGLSAIAQVDLKERIHHNQPLEALSKMAFVILQTVMRRLERRYDRAILEEVNRTMKFVRYTRGSYYLDVEEVAEHERPPMITIPEYLETHCKEEVAA